MGDGARVRVLGGLRVDDVAERDLGSRKGRTLLKALAVARGRPVSIDRLADILWGDAPPAKPAEQVGVLVSRLRGVLGAERLVRTDAGYSLRLEWLDLDELAARVDEARTALAEQRFGAAFSAAQAATALVRGSVLPEEDGDWLTADRAEAEALTTAARRIAAEAAAGAGDHLAASAFAEQALASDPYDERSLRVLMRAHATAGRPASALAAYGRVRARLAEDLGVSPTGETEALHDAILLDEPSEPAGSAPSTMGEGWLPGREAELAELDAAFERALAGTPVTVVVEGEPGIGKSALLETWTRRVAPRALTLVGRCDQLGLDLPLQPIVDAVAGRLAALAEDERLDVLGPEAPVVGPLLGVTTPTGGSGLTIVADADVGRARLFGALRTVITRLAGERPVVLAVDDLHLAGPSTLAWLAFATRRTGPLLVVAARRSGRDPGLPDAATVQLGPIDVDAAAQIVGAVRAAELHARSGGHPLLLTALATGGDAPDLTTVRDAVERRASVLGPAAATIRTAAVLGGAIDLDLLADVLRAPAADLLEHLEAAVAAGLLVARGTGFAFRHELEREALDLSAGSARRALVHREAARRLAVRPASDPLSVAVHARLGGDTALAAQAYVTAAEVSAGRFDLEAAEAHLDAALALDDAPAARTARARVRMAANRLDDAADDAALAVARGGGSAALEVAGWVAYYQRRYDEARTFAEDGVAQADDGAVRASCLALAARVRHGSGDLRGAVARLEEAMGEHGPPEVHDLAGVWLAMARLHEGRAHESLALLRRALVDPDRLAHPFAALHGRFARVIALGHLGRVAEALAACDDFDAAVARAGAVGSRMVGPAANCRAWILRWSGLMDEADEHNRAAIEVTDPTGPRAEAYYAGVLDMADGRVLAGDLAGAAAHVDRLATIEGWDGTMAWHQRHRWALLQARLAFADGDRDTAAFLAASVAGDAGARGARRYELLATAIEALAGGEAASDLPRLAEVVAGLASCAALDGWSLVAWLADAFDVAEWRGDAARRAAAVVRTSPHPDATRALVDRVLR